MGEEGECINAYVPLCEQNKGEGGGGEIGNLL